MEPFAVTILQADDFARLCETESARGHNGPVFFVDTTASFRFFLATPLFRATFIADKVHYPSSKPLVEKIEQHLYVVTTSRVERWEAVHSCYQSMVLPDEPLF